MLTDRQKQIRRGNYNFKGIGFLKENDMEINKETMKKVKRLNKIEEESK